MDGSCRTDSDSSAITVESLHRDGNPTMAQSAEWTNEKHNAYLDFLETSFVQQLHGSMGLGRCRSRQQIWGPFSAKTCSSSGQLVVLRDGSWHKIKGERNEPFYDDDDAVNPHGGLENPWICHFNSVDKHQTASSFHTQKDGLLCNKGFYLREEMNVSCEPAGISQQHLDCLQNSIGSITEVTDQNFVDEDQGDRSSFSPVAKRSRMAPSDASSDDQVVPVEKRQTPNISTVYRASSEREEAAHQCYSQNTPRDSLPEI